MDAFSEDMMHEGVFDEDTMCEGAWSVMMGMYGEDSIISLVSTLL